MKNLKTSELSNLSDDDLVKRLNELRTDLSRLRSSAARGTLKKELGEIKTVRRNIARVLTSMNSRKAPLKTVSKASISADHPTVKAEEKQSNDGGKVEKA